MGTGGLISEPDLLNLLYCNRLETLLLTNPDGTSYLFHTNIGNNRSTSVEALIETQLLRTNKCWLVVLA